MKKYDIVVGSPVDYDRLVAEIRIDGRYLALISQEDGPDHMRIEFLEHHSISSVEYDVLLAALEDARNALLD